MLHRKQQTKDSKFTTARNLSTPRWLVFPRVPPSLPTNNGGVHLTVPGHKHGHKFFVADLTPRAWPTVNFSTPFHFPFHFFPSFLSSLLLFYPRSHSLLFQPALEKSFYESIHSRGRPQPQSWSFLPKRYHIVEVFVSCLATVTLPSVSLIGILIILYN